MYQELYKKLITTQMVKINRHVTGSQDRWGFYDSGLHEVFINEDLLLQKDPTYATLAMVLLHELAHSTMYDTFRKVDILDYIVNNGYTSMNWVYHYIRIEEYIADMICLELWAELCADEIPENVLKIVSDRIHDPDDSLILMNIGTGSIFNHIIRGKAAVLANIRKSEAA